MRVFQSAGRCDVDGNGLQRMKSYDAVLFDVLKVPAEAFAVSLFPYGVRSAISRVPRQSFVVC